MAISWNPCVADIQLIPFWGMLGLWTNKVGYHNTWEFYFYNVSRLAAKRIERGPLFLY